VAGRTETTHLEPASLKRPAGQMLTLSAEEPAGQVYPAEHGKGQSAWPGSGLNLPAGHKRGVGVPPGQYLPLGQMPVQVFVVRAVVWP
jgi:hypothetical protein